jgi:hypothetical protein
LEFPERRTRKNFKTNSPKMANLDRYIEKTTTFISKSEYQENLFWPQVESESMHISEIMRDIKANAKDHQNDVRKAG